MFNDLITIFEESNKKMLTYDKDLLIARVSERTLCGALMLHLHENLKYTKFNRYFVDVEYNRNRGGKLKTLIKTIHGIKSNSIKVNCDLIVHSRGNNIHQDNLIAIEMKKSSRPKKEKDSDRERLIALTKDSFDDIWSFDGKTLPEHVCRYKLGVYYEINFKTHEILLEYYTSGRFNSKKVIFFKI